MDLVGNCTVCQKAVYCKGGFLDGVTENHTLYCHSCFEALQSERERSHEPDSADESKSAGTGE